MLLSNELAVITVEDANILLEIINKHDDRKYEIITQLRAADLYDRLKVLANAKRPNE